MTDTGKVSELVARLRKQYALKLLSGEGSLSGKPFTLDSEAADCIEALAAKLAEAEKDAERYRHMRVHYCGYEYDSTVGSFATGDGADLDAAIDAAMGSEIGRKT